MNETARAVERCAQGVLICHSPQKGDTQHGSIAGYFLPFAELVVRISVDIRNVHRAALGRSARRQSDSDIIVGSYQFKAAV